MYRKLATAKGYNHSIIYLIRQWVGKYKLQSECDVTGDILLHESWVNTFLVIVS